MKRFSALCLLTTFAAASEKPVNIVPDGGLWLMVANSLVSANGTWAVTSDLSGAYAKTVDPGVINSTSIVCQRKEQFCYEGSSWVDASGKLHNLLTRYEVTNWSDTVVHAESAQPCHTFELSFVRETKDATKTVRPGGMLTPKHECKDPDEELLVPVVMKLMSPAGAAKYQKDRTK